ncbi:hypothetical protein FRX31_024044 [Thalictrum thalictroides]|uniref:Uncharacterized protein n=1 Tax=Thalictrum thalictroides TaxID=46969 RepID=A0A7J6VMN5_THATH|nr:hypothetical protein FRX31_024044 [Thalictrum thalictroides]
MVEEDGQEDWASDGVSHGSVCGSGSTGMSPQVQTQVERQIMEEEAHSEREAIQTRNKSRGRSVTSGSGRARSIPPFGPNLSLSLHRWGFLPRSNNKSNSHKGRGRKQRKRTQILESFPETQIRILSREKGKEIERASESIEEDVNFSGNSSDEVAPFTAIHEGNSSNQIVGLDVIRETQEMRQERESKQEERRNYMMALKRSC